VAQRSLNQWMQREVAQSHEIRAEEEEVEFGSEDPRNADRLSIGE